MARDLDFLYQSFRVYGGSEDDGFAAFVFPVHGDNKMRKVPVAEKNIRNVYVANQHFPEPVLVAVILAGQLVRSRVSSHNAAGVDDADIHDAAE